MRGKNDQGVDVVSVLLSTEPEGFDGLVQDFAETHRFDLGGLDSDSMRENVRLGFSHFSGIDPELDSFRVPIGNRRRFVVLDTTTPENEVLFVTNDYRSAKSAEVMAAIESVTPDTGIQPGDDAYALWLSSFGLSDEAGDDPDADGLSNELEFIFNSDPLDAGALSGPQVRLQSDLGRVLEYQGRLDLGGLQTWMEFSQDLRTWHPLDVPETAMLVTPLADGESQRTTVLLDMVKTANVASAPGLHFRIGVSREVQ